MSLSRIGPITSIILLVLASVAACSNSGATELAVKNAWVRPPMTTDLPAAGYLTIVGGSEEDALVAASSPVATSVEIHETMADASGMTGMHAVDEIDVAAGATVTLEPGGYHLMLMGVTDLPPVGATVQLTLTFEQAGDIVVDAEVRAG